MSHKIVLVSPSWEHPKNEQGEYIPLIIETNFDERLRHWKLCKEKWDAGFALNFGFQFNRENNPSLWKPIPEDSKHMSYEEYSGEKEPIESNYLPTFDWRFGFEWMIYKNGVPVSSKFKEYKALIIWFTENLSDGYDFNYNLNKLPSGYLFNRTPLELSGDDDSLQNYLYSMDRNDKDFTGLVYFKDEGVLCGSFDNYYGFVSITNYKNDLFQQLNAGSSYANLKSTVTALLEWKERAYKLSYNFPYSIQEYINKKWNFKSQQYLSNNPTERTARFFVSEQDLPEMPDWISFDECEKHLCSRSELTSEQLVDVIQYISSLSNASEIMKEYHEKVENSYQSYLHEVDCYPTYEKPVLFSIDGTDDCSYQKCFSNIGEARIAYEILKQRGKTDDFHDIIKDLGFQSI